KHKSLVTATRVLKTEPDVVPVPMVCRLPDMARPGKLRLCHRSYPLSREGAWSTPEVGILALRLLVLSCVLITVAGQRRTLTGFPHCRSFLASPIHFRAWSDLWATCVFGC